MDCCLLYLPLRSKLQAIVTVPCLKCKLRKRKVDQEYMEQEVLPVNNWHGNTHSCRCSSTMCIWVARERQTPGDNVCNIPCRCAVDLQLIHCCMPPPHPMASETAARQGRVSSRSVRGPFSATGEALRSSRWSAGTMLAGIETFAAEGPWMQPLRLNPRPPFPPQGRWPSTR